MRASSVSIALQLLRFAVNLGVSMALARLLAPEDFGVYGMAATAVGLLMLFRDGGVEAAMLHRHDISERELASLASLNALYGFGLAVVCAVLAPILARFYGEPRLEAAMLLVSVCFVGYGIDVQPGALLLRAHRFQAHAWVEFIALVVGLAVALALALGGAGYWALFGMDLTVCVATLIGHWRAAGWRARFGGGLRDVMSFAAFGRDVSFVRILGHVAMNIDNVLVGLNLGPAALAFYAKAFRLVSMPQEGVNWPVSRVAVPTLSRLRDQPAAYVAAFRRLNLISAALGMPWAVFFFVAAAPLVRVVYGPQWSESVPLVRLLSAMGFCNTILLATVWVYVSTGTVRRQVWWEAINVVVLTIAFLIGLRWNLVGVAAAASIAHVGLRAPALLYCFRDTFVSGRDLAAVLWRPALAAAVGGAAAWAGHRLGTPATPVIALLADGFAVAAGYAIGWVAVPGWKAFLEKELRT